MMIPNIKRGRRTDRRRMPLIAEVLESRQLLAGDVALSGWDGHTVVGEQSTGAVARFEDLGPDATLDTVTIDWGDGTTSAGDVFPYYDWNGVIFVPVAGSDPLLGTPQNPPTFTHGAIRGTHTYTAAGTFAVTTSVVEQVPGQADQTIVTTATVTVDPRSVAPTPSRNVPAATGTPLTDVLAHLDANFTTDPADWTATIDWGDGSEPTTGHVTSGRVFALLIALDGQFQPVNNSSIFVVHSSPMDDTVSLWPTATLLVSGDHAYAHEGDYTVTITIDDGHGLTATSTAAVEVNDSPLLVGGLNGTTIADPGHSVLAHDIPVATVTDISEYWTTGVLSNYHATIDWGDGSPPTDGTLADMLHFPEYTGHYTFTVYGSHVYATEGEHTATISVTDADGHVTTSTVSIQAKSETLDLQPVVGELTRTVPNSTIVLRGFDSILGNLDYNFGMMAATIDWGDGSAPTIGFVSPDISTPGGQAFTVTGGHAYADAGVHTIHVTITGITGVTTSIDSTVKVGQFTGAAMWGFVHNGETYGSGENGVAIVGTPGVDITSTEGYAATIDWGDGSPVEAGTLSLKQVEHEPWNILVPMLPRTLIQVSGSHAYPAVGESGIANYQITVTVTDASGETHTFTNWVTVTPALPHPPAGDGSNGGEDVVLTAQPTGGQNGGKDAQKVAPPNAGQHGKLHGHPAKAAKAVQVVKFGHPLQALKGKAKAHAIAKSRALAKARASAKAKVTASVPRGPRG